MASDVEGVLAEHHLRQPLRPAADVDVDGSSIRGGLREILVDFVGGCVSGCAGIVVGQVSDSSSSESLQVSFFRPCPLDMVLWAC